MPVKAYKSMAFKIELEIDKQAENHHLMQINWSSLTVGVHCTKISLSFHWHFVVINLIIYKGEEFLKMNEWAYLVVSIKQVMLV